MTDQKDRDSYTFRLQALRAFRVAAASKAPASDELKNFEEMNAHLVFAQYLRENAPAAKIMSWMRDNRLGWGQEEIADKARVTQSDVDQLMTAIDDIYGGLSKYRRGIIQSSVGSYSFNVIAFDGDPNAPVADIVAESATAGYRRKFREARAARKAAAARQNKP
jgi:hypothetical protein